jgi:ethanolamine ammonia-lyase large subunit
LLPDEPHYFNVEVTYRASLRGETFAFADLRTLLARASEQKSGDELAGVAARSERERVAAKVALADIPLARFVDDPPIDDAVTGRLLADLDVAAHRDLASWTVGELREAFLAEAPVPSRALLPEMVGAVARLMSDLDLVVAAKARPVVGRCRTTAGGPGVLACRLQPNHPHDDFEGIAWSILDGLSWGCGDALIGINPCIDTVDSVGRLLRRLHELIALVGVPTQGCVLAHVTTQLRALAAGAPVDLLFQSIAGSEAANASFGIDIALLDEGRAAVLAHHAGRASEFVGDQVMYFETGQGSALSADAAFGVDQLTMEARAQGLARSFDPFLVNSVVGFIGPEYLADARQIIRAGLEDHFVGKALGLPMGCDVCYTNHADADQSTTDDLLVLLASAGCTFVMGVPAGDDVMLNYQTTSYHDVATVRRLLGLRPTPAFDVWYRDVLGAPDGSTRAPATNLLAKAASVVRELSA